MFSAMMPGSLQMDSMKKTYKRERREISSRELYLVGPNIASPLLSDFESSLGASMTTSFHTVLLFRILSFMRHIDSKLNDPRLSFMFLLLIYAFCSSSLPSFLISTPTVSACQQLSSIVQYVTSFLFCFVAFVIWKAI